MDHGQGNGQGNASAQGNGNGNGNANGHAGQGHGNFGNAGNGGTGSVDSNEASVDTSNLPGNSEAGLENALSNGQGHKYGIYKRLEKEGDTASNGEIASSTVAGGTTTVNGQSSFLYYYHPDHLGSTGFVTDGNGKLYEHMEYFPFGETWVDEHSNTLRTPYLFTGKEYDLETGLYYFGARYYDPRTSVWQSGDPILDAYLPEGIENHDDQLPAMGGVYTPFNLNLYGYSHQNPLRLVDPDGRAPKSFNVKDLRDIAKIAPENLGEKYFARIEARLANKIEVHLYKLLGKKLVEQGIYNEKGFFAKHTIKNAPNLSKTVAQALRRAIGTAMEKRGMIPKGTNFNSLKLNGLESAEPEVGRTRSSGEGEERFNGRGSSFEPSAEEGSTGGRGAYRGSRGGGSRGGGGGGIGFGGGGGGGGSSGGCFIRGTLVSTPNGLRRIEKIALGEQVWAWDEKTGTVHASRVVGLTHAIRRDLVAIYVNNARVPIISSSNHRYYVVGHGFVEAKSLVAGDHLLSIQGEEMTVTKTDVKNMKNETTVYNFEVEGYHTYFVSKLNVLVHNNKLEGGGLFLGHPEEL